MEFITNWFKLCCKSTVTHTSMKLPLVEVEFGTYGLKACGQG